MKNNRLVSLISGCLLINMFIPAICSGGANLKNVTVGIIDGVYYYPPSRIYKVKIPVDRKYFGGKIQGQENAVSFTDDFCHLYRIEFMPISPEKWTNLKEIDKEKYLKEMFEKWYMPLTIWNLIKESTIDYQEYLGQLFEGTYYSEVYMPKGSICKYRTSGRPFARRDGRRGILAFIHGDYGYFVSVGFEAKEDRSLEKIEDTRKNIRDAAVSFAQTIQFP
jgi:hypothetical protein